MFHILAVICPYTFCDYSQAWWHTPVMPALQRQRQVDLCDFKANLVYRVNQGSQGEVHKETLSPKTKKTNQNQNKTQSQLLPSPQNKQQTNKKKAYYVVKYSVKCQLLRRLA